MLVALLPLIAIVEGASADTDKFNLAVDCRCTDSVGKQFCAEVKDTITSSPNYRLSNGNTGYGIGLHFRCVDLWVGIEKGLVGRMSAVSVAFTIYSDKLPGEVYEDSSEFRVGKD